MAGEAGFSLFTYFRHLEGGLAASWCFSESKPQNAHLRGDSHNKIFQKNLRWRPSRCPMNILRPLLACNRGVISSQKWPHNFHRPPGRSPYEIFWNHAQSVTNSGSKKNCQNAPTAGEFSTGRGGRVLLGRVVYPWGVSGHIISDQTELGTILSSLFSVVPFRNHGFG